MPELPAPLVADGAAMGAPLTMLLVTWPAGDGAELAAGKPCAGPVRRAPVVCPLDAGGPDRFTGPPVLCPLDAGGPDRFMAPPLMPLDAGGPDRFMGAPVAPLDAGEP
jgi:hypothetical protein